MTKLYNTEAERRLANSLKEYFTRKSCRDLFKMVKGVGIKISDKERRTKLSLVSSLTKTCLKKPHLLHKLKLDLPKSKIVKRLSIGIDSENAGLVGMTENSYYWLEDIFSIRGPSLKKTTITQWMRTQSFKDHLDALFLQTKIPKEDLVVKELIGKTLVHPVIAAAAFHYKSPKLYVAFELSLVVSSNS